MYNNKTNLLTKFKWSDVKQKNQFLRRYLTGKEIGNICKKKVFSLKRADDIQDFKDLVKPILPSGESGM